jgi:hypothetical protein
MARVDKLGVQAYLVKAEVPPEQIEAKVRELATQK